MRAATFRFINAAPAMGHPDELLAALHAIARKYSRTLNATSAWLLPPRWSARYNNHQLNRTCFFGPGFRGSEFWAQYVEHAGGNGGSALNDYGRSVSAPFTLTEAMRTLQLTAHSRWVFVLLHDFGVRDGLYCPYRRWAVLFGSEEFLHLDPIDRRILGLAGAVAVEHLERLVMKGRALLGDGVPFLTERKLEVLRLRAAGKKPGEIAGILGIKPLTARNHLDQIVKVLGATDMVHAVMKAVRFGLLASGPQEINRPGARRAAAKGSGAEALHNQRPNGNGRGQTIHCRWVSRPPVLHSNHSR